MRRSSAIKDRGTTPSERTGPLVGEAIRKHFSGVQALQGVSITLPAGQILGLIGPNGSGKTTLINVLSGVYPPDGGTVTCGAVDITGAKPHQIARQGVGRTYQNIRVFGHLAVRQNVEVGALCGRHQSGSDHDSVVDDLLQRFHLTDLAASQARSLPYGAQRRVEIARALAASPRFLLLDEPAAGMNEAESDDLLETIRGVRDDFGCAILVVDHDLRLIMRLCERIQVLAEGSTLAEGTPQEVRVDEHVIEVFLGDALTDEESQ